MTRDKFVCSVYAVETFQKRMALAIKRAGGQSELARKLEKCYGIKTAPQRIQYLQDESKNKPAKGSRITAQIAGIAGLRAEWLASGKGPRDEGASGTAPVAKSKVTHQQVGIVGVKIKETGETIHMELTQEAIDVARKFMDLSKKERARFHRSLDVEHMSHAEEASSPKVEEYAKQTARAPAALKPKHHTS